METVKCCDRNNGWIYYDDAGGVFKLLGYDDTSDDPDTGNHPVEYCPWCGILLDTNLLEK